MVDAIHAQLPRGLVGNYLALLTVSPHLTGEVNTVINLFCWLDCLDLSDLAMLTVSPRLTGEVNTAINLFCW